MTPVSPLNYKGINYIQLDQLPFDQRFQIDQWIPVTGFIKIKMAETIVDHCVNYQDYLHWFENHYSPEGELSRQI